MPDEAPRDSYARDVEAMRPICVECQRSWEVTDERWRAFQTDDEPPALVFYCPACAELEFG